MLSTNISILVDLIYIVSSILFIFGLKLLGSHKTAQHGNFISAIGMIIAVVVTLFDQQITSYQWIIVGIVLGSFVGIFVAQRITMTSIPEMVALFNSFGGLASLLVGWSEYHRYWETVELVKQSLLAIFIAIIIGSITFSGSVIAYGKLSGKIPSKPIMIPIQQIINIFILTAILFSAIAFCTFGLHADTKYTILLFSIGFALLLGITSVLPIGGADMPVVISLLNSYSGLAACATGFVILNNVLIVVGALVGSSGIILTKIMCKSMNRPLANVLFSGFGKDDRTQLSKSTGEVNSITVEDIYFVLEASRSVLIIPGYGMAVAQAQHAVRELVVFLEKNGSEVKYVIHPVAGRMPGHMNVLLAEANVPYEQLVQPEDVNPTMETIDVCLVIGANDVVNPAARDDKSCPIYGMPIIEVDRAKSVFILKRSMNTGFSNLENTLFTRPNTRILFGDGKETVTRILAEFKTNI